MTSSIRLYNLELKFDLSEKECFFTVMKNLTTMNQSDITYLLDTSNMKSFIEKTVYDIACFHCERLNMSIDNTFVEFSFKNDSNPQKLLYLNCDEYDRQINKNDKYTTAIMSCITYFNDNSIPTLITNINQEEYKFKEFSSHPTISLSFPRVLKHISFEGGKEYHGDVNILDSKEESTGRHILLINLWEKRPMNIPIFDFRYIFYKYSMMQKTEMPLIEYNTSNPIIILTEQDKEKTQIIELEKDVLSDTFFEKLFFTDYNTNIFDILISKIDINKYDTFIFKPKKSLPISELKSNNLSTNNNQTNELDFKLPRFNQRFITPNILSKHVCQWIIKEYEEYASNNGGWSTDRHKTYPTTDLPASCVDCTFRFILHFFFEIIHKTIINSYCLDDISVNISFNIRDIFIVKYEYGKQEFLEMHTDDSCITVNILLNDESSFTGGGTLFDDGLLVKANQGDMIIHSSKTHHSGLPILSGKRYLLVFFIDLFSTN